METEALRLVFWGVFFFCFGLSTAAFINGLLEYGISKLRNSIYYAIATVISLLIAGLVTNAIFVVGKIF